MERNVLKKRIKGLLAFVLVFMMMFGSSLTVLATEWDITELDNTDVLSGEDSIKIPAIYGTAGTIKLVIDDEEKATGNPVYLPPDGSWRVGSSSETADGWIVSLWSISAGGVGGTSAAIPAPEPTGNICQHDYEWVIGLYPTEEKDGRFDYECKHCSSVTAHQPMTFFYAIIWNILEDIKEAPVNGVVTVDNKYLRCLTDEIVEALHARPDVTLDVKFTDQEVPLHFTIPAGMAPTDGADWYGYYYLGSQYGWIW